MEGDTAVRYEVRPLVVRDPSERYASKPRRVTYLVAPDGRVAQAYLVAPEQVPACESGGDTGISLGGYTAERRAFVFLEFLVCSWGGRPFGDGIDGGRGDAGVVEQPGDGVIDGVGDFLAREVVAHGELRLHPGRVPRR